MADYRTCLATARDHLVTRGVTDFGLAAVAEQCGTDVRELEGRWGDAGALALEVWESSLSWALDTDTGTLSGDLDAFAAAIASMVADEDGRALFTTALPRDGVKIMNRRRLPFWNSQFDAAEAILARARHRGEIADNVDTADAIRMLGTALCFDPLYKDRALRPDYVAAVIDLFCHGVAERPAPAHDLGDRLLSVEQSPFGADHSSRITDYFMASRSRIRQAILDRAVEEHLDRGITSFAVEG